METVCLDCGYSFRQRNRGRRAKRCVDCREAKNQEWLDQQNFERSVGHYGLITDNTHGVPLCEIYRAESDSEAERRAQEITEIEEALKDLS